jgi:hypothetical protein
MFCPRCGQANPESTKFCRQCGLGLTPISSYVATGGTGQLAPPPDTAVSASRLAELTAGYSPKQKMWLTILCLVFLPGMIAVMTGPLGMESVFVPMAGVLMCVGIPWAVVHFHNQARLLEQQRWQMQMQMSQQPPMGLSMPPAQQSLPQPQQQPYQAPSHAPMPQPVQQPYAPQSVYQPSPAPPRQSPDTNPLGKAPGSVTEDETRRLRDQ